MDSRAQDRRRERWLIRGRVQGVCFRAFTQEQARSLGISGWVRNLPDGRVEAGVTGDAVALTELERALRRGPRASRVDALERLPSESEEPSGSRFEIRGTPTSRS